MSAFALQYAAWPALGSTGLIATSGELFHWGMSSSRAVFAIRFHVTGEKVLLPSSQEVDGEPTTAMMSIADSESA